MNRIHLITVFLAFLFLCLTQISFAQEGQNLDNHETFKKNDTLQFTTIDASFEYDTLMQLHSDGTLVLPKMGSGTAQNLGVDAEGKLTVQSGTEFTGNQLMNAVLHGEERLFADLDLNGSGSGNVIQGFVVDNKNGEIYTTHSTGSPEKTIVNRFAFNGTDEPTNLGNSQNLTLGHPQDLGIEYLTDGSVRLWTMSSSTRGVARIDFNGSSTTHTSYELFTDPNRISATPTISTNGQYLVTRLSDASNPTTNDQIYVFRLADVLANNVTPITSFTLHPDQMISHQWFQGLVCDNDIIYCLTGDNTMGNNKLLYAYTLGGGVLFKKELTTGKADAQNTGLGNHWEPEGMSVYHPNPYTKVLLVGICSGISGFRAKRIYSIGLGNGIVDIDGDQHPYDAGLHFSGGGRDISYKPSHVLQFGQLDDADWTERMRLNVDGYLGIGTTNPTQLLQIGNSGDGSKAISNQWSTFSDARLKTNIRLIPSVLKKLNQINGYYYDWKKGTDANQQIGVLAQEIETVFPEIVSENTEGIKAVDYSKLTPVLLNAIKEQQELIEIQAKEMELLKKNQTWMQEQLKMLIERK